MIFKRALAAPMIEALNAEYNKGGWWKALADDKDTLIAIRDQYLNVYRNGCNLAKVSYSDGKLVANIHYKYLLAKKIPKPYVDCIGGVPQINDHAYFFISSLGQIDDIKSATDAYGGDEKVGVHKIILENQNIIDTEIALSGNDSDDEDSRIDFCAIRKEEGNLFLRFFEAKHYSYKGALRAKNGDAKVIGQLEKYSTTLGQHGDEILAAYKESIRVSWLINGSNVLGKNWGQCNLDNLEIDKEPRLVVFGFDDDQKNGSNFKRHMGKLKENIQSRLLLKGDAKDFAVGISK